MNKYREELNIRPALNPTIQVTVNTYTKHKPLSRNLFTKIRADCMERKKNEKYREEQKGESQFSITRYNLSLPFCIPNYV